jgi:serine/threonine protein kinase
VNEIRILASIKSRNIVRYCDAFVERDNLYIIMEFAEGGDIGRQIEKFKKVSSLDGFGSAQGPDSLAFIFHRFTSSFSCLRSLPGQQVHQGRHHLELLHSDLPRPAGDAQPQYPPPRLEAQERLLDWQEPRSSR